MLYAMAIDPICGMTVDASAARSAARDGRTWYFCSEHCRQKFMAETAPPKPCCHAEKEQKPAERKQQPGVYTCPMHPEIEQDGPGSCPICGMDLEPKVSQPGREDDSELRSMTRRFWVALALTIPVFL